MPQPLRGDAGGNRATYHRSLGLERFSFNTDGSIQAVKYTMDGITQAGMLDPYVRVEAETFNAQSGIETEVCEGGTAVTQIGNGDWVAAEASISAAGARSFSARVASAGAGGSIELRLASATARWSAPAPSRARAERSRGWPSRATATAR